MSVTFRHNLPTVVKSGDKVFNIREKCDYRIVLKCIAALNDEEIDERERIESCLVIFYENFEDIEKADVDVLITEMFDIISCGMEPENNGEKPIKLMDWEHDFGQIAPPVNRILGYDIRQEDKYVHWHTFLGAYQEIGECTWQTFINIREKLRKHKKLEDWEREVYRNHKRQIDLPMQLTEDEKEFLFSD